MLLYLQIPSFLSGWMKRIRVNSETVSVLKVRNREKVWKSSPLITKIHYSITGFRHKTSLLQQKKKKLSALFHFSLDSLKGILPVSKWPIESYHQGTGSVTFTASEETHTTYPNQLIFLNGQTDKGKNANFCGKLARKERSMLNKYKTNPLGRKKKKNESTRAKEWIQGKK